MCPAEESPRGKTVSADIVSIYARCRVAAPADVRYWVLVKSETVPSGPAFVTTGCLDAGGLHPGAESLSSATPLTAGTYTVWAKLPTSAAPQWHTGFLFHPATPMEPAAMRDMRLEVQFSIDPDPSGVFHRVAGPPEELGPTYRWPHPQYAAMLIRMPTAPTREALTQVMSFTEWARARLGLLAGPALKPPPHLSRLRIGTWAMLGSRVASGNVTRERADLDFRIWEALGINQVTVENLADPDFQSLAGAHAVVDSSLTAWADNWRYTPEHLSHKYDLEAGETPERWIGRVLPDFYRRSSAETRTRRRWQAQVATHVNLGDEIMPAITAAEIVARPAILAEFQAFAARIPGIGPNPLPLDDRSKLADPAAARRFYATHSYTQDYTRRYYATAARAAKAEFPQARLVAPNFQAGPMQYGFLGNDNDVAHGALDLFRISTGLSGALTEDWTPATDLGLSRIAWGCELMRACARTNGGPPSVYLVGGSRLRQRMYTALMSGIRDIGLYLYGPISNIGPAWGDDATAYTEIAQTTRELKPYETFIASARVRPTRAAVLVSFATDLLQPPGNLYCFPERQHLFAGLRGQGVAVDLIGEQDVLNGARMARYSVLYLSDPNTPTAVQTAIANWVQNGGRLWAEVGAACWDEFNRPCDLLDPVFGVRSRRMVKQSDWLQPTSWGYQPGVSRFAYKQVDSIQPSAPGVLPGVCPAWGARMECEVDRGKVVGQYGSGDPAAVLHAYGKGEALLVGALVGEAYIRARYPERPASSPLTFNRQSSRVLSQGAEIARYASLMAGRAKVARPMILSQPGILSAVLDAPQGSAILLVNGRETSVGALTVQLKLTAPIKSVRSAVRGKLPVRVQNGRAEVTLPFEDADLLVFGADSVRKRAA